MVLLISLFFAFQNPTTAQSYRHDLDRAYKSEDYADSLYVAWKAEELKPIGKAYLAVLEMIQADHSMAPWSKMSYFRSGEARLNKAVEEESQNIEIRYLRFACQTEAPDFLGYDEYLIDDKEFLMASFKTVEDEDLKRRIRKIVMNSRHVDESERKVFL